MAGPVKVEPQKAPAPKAAKASAGVERAPVQAAGPMGAVSILSQPMPPNGGPSKRQAVLHLQRTIGNQATDRLLRRLTQQPPPPGPGQVQAKLTVGPADDPYEREADAAASRIESGQPVERISRLPAGGAAPSLHQQEEVLKKEQKKEQEEEGEELETESVQRTCAACDDEERAQREVKEAEEQQPAQTAVTQRKTVDPEDEEPVQTRSAAAETHVDTDRAAEAMTRAGSGTPLNPAIQAEMEQGFGADFSGVRIHTGAAANEAADAISARAFTHGSGVYMGRGASPTDRHLIAHELTHVVQQESADIRRQQICEGAIYDEERQECRPHDSESFDDTIAGEEDFGEFSTEQMAEAGSLALGTVLQGFATEAGPLRDAYNAGVEQIVAERARMLREILPESTANEIIGDLGNNLDRRQMVRKLTEALPEEQATRLAQRVADMRHRLALDIRKAGGTLIRKGAELVDAVRGQGRPTYSSLRASGKSNAEIIRSATRTNRFINRLPTGLRWTGRGFWALSAGISLYVILDAPTEERGQVAREEIGSLVGGVAGTVVFEGICVVTGVATGGVGLIVCGVLGGFVGAAVGRDPVGFLQILDIAPHQSAQVAGRMYRIEGPFEQTDLIIISIVTRSVDASEHVLVIGTGEVSGSMVGGRGHYRRIKVVPANRSAVDLFGSTDEKWIPDYLLHSPSSEDLIAE